MFEHDRAAARWGASRVTRLMSLGVALLVVAAAAGCGAAASAQPSFTGAQVPGTPAAPDFTLTDQSGARVSLSAQRGRPVLVTFLYTNCPDVCPLIAQNLNTVLRSLRASAGGAQVLAVSVDPVGDTPANVRAFVQRHHLVPAFRYLTGTRPELQPIWADYRIAVAAGATPSFTTHSAATYLIDSTGHERVLYTSAAVPADIEHDIRLLGR